MQRKLPLLVALAGLALLAPSADASFHLTKVREVFPGSNANAGNDAFIELQSFEAGQNFVAGHKVDYYTATGTLLGSYTIAANVANGESQRSILIGDTLAGGSPDFVVPQLGDAIHAATAGGAVCFPDGAPPDCVSWGSFSGNALIPAPGAGTPVAPGGIPDGKSITRSIQPNCPTLLEAADDTDNSVADFAVTDPTPRNNSVTPTELPCAADTTPPETTITKKPPKKTEHTTARLKFTSSEANSTFECSKQRGTFKPCSSPKVYRHLQSGGRQLFMVVAIDSSGNRDPTPARASWRVVSD
jgi:hypothetical protein